MFMVVSGHTWAPVPVVPYRIAKGDRGNRVYELLVNFQNQDDGGNGWFVLLTFHPTDTVEVQVYSPYLGVVASEQDPFGFTSQFAIDLNSGTVRHPSYR